VEGIVKRVNKKQAEYVTPDVEITIRTGETELAAIAFYAASDNTWDVLVGVHNPSSRDNLSKVLQWAAEAIESSTFAITGLVDPEAGREGGERFNDLPF
jgi:hypothetical protein